MADLGPLEEASLVERHGTCQRLGTSDRPRPRAVLQGLPGARTANHDDGGTDVSDTGSGRRDNIDRKREELH